jgi:hypothetical protein
MRDTGYGMRDARHNFSKNTSTRARSFLALLGGEMACFDCADEAVQLGSGFVQTGVDRFENRFIGQRTCVEKFFEMVDGFVAGTVGVGEMFDELQFVASPTISFDDVASHRLSRASYLRRSFKLLKLRKFRQRHAVDVNCDFASQFPNVQVSITHRKIDTGCTTQDARCELPSSIQGQPYARQRKFPKQPRCASRIAHPASRIT